MRVFLLHAAFIANKFKPPNAPVQVLSSTAETGSLLYSDSFSITQAKSL